MASCYYTHDDAATTELRISFNPEVDPEVTITKDTRVVITLISEDTLAVEKVANNTYITYDLNNGTASDCYDAATKILTLNNIPALSYIGGSCIKIYANHSDEFGTTYNFPEEGFTVTAGEVTEVTVVAEPQ